MIRLLILGDVHFTAHNPVARRDDFKTSLTAKLLECWEIARQHEVHAIIQTGDVFNSPQIVYTTLADLMRILRQAPAPVFSVPGNHDLFGSPSTLYRTPLGFLFQLGILRNAEQGDRITHDDLESCLEGLSVRLTGRGYDAATDVDPRVYLPGTELQPGEIHVHMTHGMLVDQPVPSRHTLIASLGELDGAPHVIVNGHYHLGTGIKRAGRTLVINPGALCRNSAHLEEIERPVQVALLTIDGQEYDAELIPLQSARPGSEVISREHLIEEAQRERKLQDFLDLLAGDAAVQATDLQEMLTHVASMATVPSHVLDEALRYVGQVMADQREEAVAA